MHKSKTYEDVRFSADTLREAVTQVRSLLKEPDAGFNDTIFIVGTEDSQWTYNTVDEFYSEYRASKHAAYMCLILDPYVIEVDIYSRVTKVRIAGHSRGEIESVFEVFERNVEKAKLPLAQKSETTKPIVFIGHGRSSTWRDLKDHLQDKHQVKVVAYETGARAGHTIRDILVDLIGRSSFALLVLTSEDEQADGSMRARQNVIHEAGLFQGRLGFHRAIMLLEEGVDEFSNVAGIQHLQFSKGNIKEVFGEVLATLKREFGQ